MWRQVNLAISLIASAIAVSLSLLLTFAPQTESRPIVAFIGLALAFAIFAGRSRVKFRPTWGWLVLALAIGLLAPVTAIARAFGDIDMLAILFHVDFGTQGAGLGGLERDVAVAAFVAVSSFIGLVMIGQIVLRDSLLWFFGALILVGNPVLREMVVMAMPSTDASYTESLLPELVNPRIIADPPDDRPDVIIIYLEGMDRIFEDQSLFPDALDRLKSLAGPV